VTVVIQGLELPALSEGSRLFWALLSLVHERFGYRALAPDRIQGDAVIPHSSYTAQSRITSSQSLPAHTQPMHRPTPPDFWWSIGAGLCIGIPPPPSSRAARLGLTLLTNQPPYKDDGGVCGDRAASPSLRGALATKQSSLLQWSVGWAKARQRRAHHLLREWNGEDATGRVRARMLCPPHARPHSPPSI
jgi:hypothetical protein